MPETTESIFTQEDRDSAQKSVDWFTEGSFRPADWSDEKKASHHQSVMEYRATDRIMAEKLNEIDGVTAEIGPGASPGMTEITVKFDNNDECDLFMGLIDYLGFHYYPFGMEGMFARGGKPDTLCCMGDFRHGDDSVDAKTFCHDPAARKSVLDQVVAVATAIRDGGDQNELLEIDDRYIVELL